MAKEHAGDAAMARNRAGIVVANALGERLEAWTGEARRTFEDFALVLAPSSPDLARWTPGEKRALVRILRAKVGPEESRFLRSMQRHAKLWSTIVRLGSQSPTARPRQD